MDYVDFRFGNFHTKDLHLLVVTSSDRYEKNLLPDPEDYSTDVPGGDGSYYFGSTFGTREFSCNIAFDKVSEEDFRKISQIFSTDKLQDLVFDELPYKTYKAKLKSKPNFKTICFMNEDTKQRVYKGEGELTFVCYFPYAFGFNKYIVRAADYYLKTPPEKVFHFNSIYDNPYEKEEKPVYSKTKEYYNVENNMDTPWKGGYPTIQQVQDGELYFNTPDGERSIIDARRYWRNIPEWQSTAKLLTTPTLDYDQELIFMPQYSKTNYLNMDTGLNQENALIGSRLLVYNPGDLPVDFEIKLDNNERSFWAGRGNHFQVRRFNVQRLDIPSAVDWTGLKTQDLRDNETFKYGDKYFKRTKPPILNDNVISFSYEELKNQHPHHAYIAEPIPREKLGHYIRTFYWQSSLLKDSGGNPILDFEEGIRFADRYEELYNLCTTDEERYELYWQTLKDAILSKYSDSKVFDAAIDYSDSSYTFDDFVYEYIHNPPEYIRRNSELFYGQFDFNLTMYPQYFTEDYLEIFTDGISKNTLFLDSEKRMLYNVNNPEYDKSNLNTYSNFYKYKPTKTVYNDNIKQGHWFKLPKGWSLIEVTPVCEENQWGGKTWQDARPFDWGYDGENGDKKDAEKTFDTIYDMVAVDYLTRCEKINESATQQQIDEAMNFRKWYEEKINMVYDFKNKKPFDNFAYELYKIREQNAEYGFLKLLHEYWRANKGKPGCTGKIEEWWWYACNYIWANFPPLYWGYADILNQAQIKYTPLFY